MIVLSFTPIGLGIYGFINQRMPVGFRDNPKMITDRFSQIIAGGYLVGGVLFGFGNLIGDSAISVYAFLLGIFIIFIFWLVGVYLSRTK